jgi:hypothetical protein
MTLREDNGLTTYVTLSVTEIDKLDFSQIQQTSAETLRLSLDGTKTIVKWYTVDGVPSCIESLTTKGPYMDHDQALVLMATSAWTDPNPIM